MSAVFRIEGKDSIEVTDGWDLQTQVEDAKNWLSNPRNAESVRSSILDIGFNSRLGVSNVAVQGETIPLEFMELLVRYHITLWLTVYPPFGK